jgi:hypothetical protein
VIRGIQADARRLMMVNDLIDKLKAKLKAKQEELKALTKTRQTFSYFLSRILLECSNRNVLI